MARTAAPVTPGTDPAAADESTMARTAAPTVEGLQAEIAEMRALMGQVVRQQQAASPQPPVDLPTMAQVMKDKPASSVLTKEGWFVPAVLPSQRQTN